jgi:hypothetical protein
LKAAPVYEILNISPEKKSWNYSAGGIEVLKRWVKRGVGALAVSGAGLLQGQSGLGGGAV